MPADRFTLAGSDVSISPLGVGTWAWGDRSTWGMGGYDGDLTRDSIREAWNASIDAGVTLFDTAEIYGRGRASGSSGSCWPGILGEQHRQWWPASSCRRRGSCRCGVRCTRRYAPRSTRLGLPAVDLYQIHGPVSLRSHAALADALAAAHQAGLVRAVGVSNYSVKETASIAEELRNRGLRLATNQIEFSLLRRSPETSGLLQACAELGVVPLAYSPIGQGRLTGKYSASHPPPGKRTFSNHPMAVVDHIVDELRAIGEQHGGKVPSQVALNWVMAKGAVPIPGAKNRHQAEENAGALGWRLTEEDVDRLDRAGLPGLRSLASRFWQHG